MERIRSPNFNKILRLMKGNTIIDGRNQYSSDFFKGTWFQLLSNRVKDNFIMNFKAIFANKSTLDFLAMFSSNIIKKFIGFAKEVILASVFGSSLLYANFILIRTVSDLFFSTFKR